MKIMIRLLLSVLWAFASCAPESEAVALSVDKTSLTFAAEGGEQTFCVTASEVVTLMPADKWITVNKGDAAGNKTTVTVTASENTAEAERKTRISIAAGRERKSVEITQAAGKIDPGILAGALPAGLGMGWNLGNHFDAYNDGVSGETAWGNPKATQATFDAVKAAGFSSVRIPVTWLGHIGGAPNYKIQDSWLNRIAEVVGYAERAGLYAIVNIHHDGADSKFWLDIKGAAKDPAVQERILAQITAMWTQIAERFKDKGEFLVFEGFNEIHDGGWGWGDNRKDGGKQYRCMNEWNQAFVDAVRSAGGCNADRYLGVPAYCTNVDIAIDAFEMPEDTAKDRLMLAVHCYDPYLYTLEAQYSEWGHTADVSKKVNGNNESDLKSVFVKLYDNFVSKGIPVYMGEFGCVNRGTAREQAFQQYYLRYYAKLAKTYGVPSIIWDNGAGGAGRERHAFIDHGTGEFCSEEAKAAIRALVDSYNNDQTLDQVYDNAPAE